MEGAPRSCGSEVSAKTDTVRWSPHSSLTSVAMPSASTARCRDIADASATSTSPSATSSQANTGTGGADWLRRPGQSQHGKPPKAVRRTQAGRVGICRSWREFLSMTDDRDEPSALARARRGKRTCFCQRNQSAMPVKSALGRHSAGMRTRLHRRPCGQRVRGIGTIATATDEGARHDPRRPGPSARSWPAPRRDRSDRQKPKRGQDGDDAGARNP